MDRSSSFRDASRFLTRCQGGPDDPVEGTVAPWELGGTLPFREDLHDTLEAVWVWSRYRELTDDQSHDRNVISALSYVRDAFDAHLKAPVSRVTRNYDATFLLLAQVQCERAYNEWPLKEESQYCRDILVKEAMALEGIDFMARNYNDPFFHMFALLRWASVNGDTTAHRVARDAVARGVDILGRSDILVAIDMEPCPEGPGGHDFMSKGGTILLAMHEADLLDIRLEKIARDLLPSFSVQGDGRSLVEWPLRPRDPSPFALSAVWGLASLTRADGSVDEHMKDVILVPDTRAAGEKGEFGSFTTPGPVCPTWRNYVRDLSASIIGSFENEFKARGGGIGRSPGFGEAESWATFFLLFAIDILED